MRLKFEWYWKSRYKNVSLALNWIIDTKPNNILTIWNVADRISHSFAYWKLFYSCTYWIYYDIYVVILNILTNVNYLFSIYN